MPRRATNNNSDYYSGLAIGFFISLLVMVILVSIFDNQADKFEDKAFKLWMKTTDAECKFIQQNTNEIQELVDLKLYYDGQLKIVKQQKKILSTLIKAYERKIDADNIP